MSRALILVYHVIDESRSVAEARYCVTPSAFRAQMAYLAASGHIVMPLADLIQALKDGTPLAEGALAITFDDGFECFWDNALPVLTEYSLPATVFAVAGRLGGTNTWMESKGWPARKLMGAPALRELRKAGISVGCHSLTHRPMTELSDDELTAETSIARQVLRDALDADVTLFAYPYGKQGDRERKAVARAGFLAACETEPGFNRHGADLFALRRIDIYGNDSLFQFRRKLKFGANQVTSSNLARYYITRFVARFGGSQ
jgi:peptidoglycan/xylan/chitin deacetylase (PgdA/CDA1 family)